MHIRAHVHFHTAFEWRKRPPPLLLTVGKEIVGDVYHTNNLELALDYLRCLVLAPDLAKKGFKTIAHKDTCLNPCWFVLFVCLIVCLFVFFRFIRLIVLEL